MQLPREFCIVVLSSTRFREIVVNPFPCLLEHLQQISTPPNILTAFIMKVYPRVGELS